MPVPLLKKCIENGTIEIPPQNPLSKDDTDTLCFFLADDAFGFKN